LRKIRRWAVIWGFVLLALALVGRFIRPIAPVLGQFKKTVEDRVAEYGDTAHQRLAPEFERIGVAFPPDRVILIGFKYERVLDVWVSPESGPPQFLKTYPILAASGVLGPKLRQGDQQVPEGLYRIESLNPNSRFHLSLRLDYPNEYDRAKAKLDGRSNLGGDIMIHGNQVSIGCLAMGDEAAEDLFVLVAETGKENVSVILSPIDFRVRELPSDMPLIPEWTGELYERVREELGECGEW
jgi:hypothetical protein